LTLFDPQAPGAPAEEISLKGLGEKVKGVLGSKEKGAA